MVTTDDIKAETTILGDIPVVFAKSLDTHHLPFCSNCSRLLCDAKEFFGNDFDANDTDMQNLVKELWPVNIRSECEGCKREFCCNHLCRQEDWNRYHCIICAQQNPQTTTLYDLCNNQGYGYAEPGQRVKLWQGQFSPMILGKMWASIVAETKRLISEAGTKSPTLDHWDRENAPLRR